MLGSMRRNNSSLPSLPSLPPSPRLAPSVVLVVGVLSFNFTGRAKRRAWIRRLSPSSAVAQIFFVLPLDQPDVDTHMDDVVRFDIPRVDRGVLGKYLLQNRWFAFGSLLPPHVEWIARMDDDAAVNGASIVRRLQWVPRDSQFTVYGPHRNWYMWHPESMQAVCWDYSPVRWWRVQQALHAPLGPPPPPPPPRRRPPSSMGTSADTECDRNGTDGPYPFSAGPFMAYSRSVAAFLMTFVFADEEYVLGERRRKPLVNAKTGFVAPPSHRSHPSQRIFMEEVYYAYVLFRELRNSSQKLLLVNEPMHEILSRTQVYDGEPIGGFGSMRHSDEIYHKLRYPSHFELLFNTSYLSTSVRAANDAPPPKLQCVTLGEHNFPAGKSATRLKQMIRARFGLRNWHRCNYVSSRYGPMGWPGLR